LTQTPTDFVPGTCCLGRPCGREGFERGRVDQHLDVWRTAGQLHPKRNRFEGGDALLAERWGLGGAGVKRHLAGQR